MFRRHAIPLFAAIVVVGVALPFSSPYTILALVPLYWLAVDRGLRVAVIASVLLVGAQVATMDLWLEPVSTMVLAAGTIGAARYLALRTRSAARERELLA